MWLVSIQYVQLGVKALCVKAKLELQFNKSIIFLDENLIVFF